MKTVQIDISLAERLLRLEAVLSEYLDSQSGKTRDEHYLTIREAADLLCKSIHTIYGMVSRREIPHIKKGNRLYFKENDLRAWLEAGNRITINEVLTAKLQSR